METKSNGGTIVQMTPLWQNFIAVHYLFLTSGLFTFLPHSHMINKALFKRRATAGPNSIDRIKFDFSTAVARRLKPSRATAGNYEETKLFW